MIPATQIRVGQVLVVDKKLYKVMATHHVTPGKGVACMQVKMRDLKSGNQTERRFNSSEKVEKAHLKTREMQYLYNDDELYHFMDTNSYEQIHLKKDELGEYVQLMLPNQMVQIDMYEGSPIGVEFPKTVNLKVTYTPPAVKTAGTGGDFKEAELETGLKVTVPSFVNIGDTIKVNTDTFEYVERA